MNRLRKELLGVRSGSGELTRLVRRLCISEEIDAFTRRIRELALDQLPGLHLPLSSRQDAPIDIIDFFSGCGGLSLGFENISTLFPAYRPIAAIDIDKYANRSFRRNFGVEPLTTDVRELASLNAGELHRLFGRVDEKARNRPLILIGGPPCQGFSSHRKKDKRKDERNTLIGVYGRLVTKLAPDAIVMENVPDLLAHKHWGHFEEFRTILMKAGYHVKAKILNAAEFGVPQERFRAVILAFRHDFDFPQGHLVRSQFRTVRDAIGELPPLRAGEQSKIDPMHITSKHRKETVETLRRVPKDGGSRPRGVGPKCLDRVAGFYDVYGRLAWSKPAVTITARCRTPSCGRFAHPEQNRGLSVREAALLQSFPKFFHFEGPFDDKFKQIGNAVPPALATSIAAHVLGVLMKRAPLGASSDRNGRADYVTAPISNSYSSVIAGIKNGNSARAVAEFCYEK